MKVKLSRIEVHPLLAEGIWFGSKLDIYVEIGIKSVITVSRVYERNRVLSYRLLAEKHQRKCAEVLAGFISKEVANGTSTTSSSDDRKTIYEVLRLKLPTFLSHAANGDLCLYDCENNKMAVVNFGIDSHGCYDRDSINFDEWPWCRPTPADFDEISKELREHDLIQQIMLGG